MIYRSEIYRNVDYLRKKMKRWKGVEKKQTKDVHC